MKKILVKAYLNFNLGDDLFIKILTERYPNINFYIESNDKKYTQMFKNNNIHLYQKSRLEKRLIKLGVLKYFFYKKFLKKIDGIINIGGSIFMENSINYKKDIEKRKIENKAVKGNYYILGANFGPFKREKFKNKYEEFFSNCKDVCFRDKYSYNLFSELPNIRYADDIVFSLKDNIAPRNIEGKILISVIKPSIRKELKTKDKEYYETIKKLILEGMESGKKIQLISFCKNEGDEEAISEIKKLLPSKISVEIDTYFYRGNIEEALEVINSSEVIIATRFHAMILGFIYEKKVVPICYSKKMLNVIKDLEFKGGYGIFDNLDTISLKSIIKGNFLEKEKLLKILKNSKEHFKKLEENIKEGE